MSKTYQLPKNKAQATKEVTPAAPASAHNYFDLLEYIRSVKDFDVAAQMAQSFVFRVDINVQSAARQLFKLIRADQMEKLAGSSTNDNLADLTAALGEAAFAEECFHEIGSDAEGIVRTIRTLMAMRDDIHEMAAELTSYCLDWQGHARSYEIPELDARFYEKPKMKIKATEARRAAKSVAIRAEAFGLSDEQAKLMLQKKMTRKEDKLREVEETLANQGHIVHVMFNIAMKADLGDFTPPSNFCDWSLDQQRQCIDAAMKAADRAEEYAERKADVDDNDADYLKTLACVMRVNTDLDNVLRSPRFRAHFAAQDAAAQNVG